MTEVTQTDRMFIQSLRTLALGDNPNADEREQYDETLQGLTLNVFEKAASVNLTELPSSIQAIRYSSWVGSLLGDSISLDASRQFEVTCKANGKIQFMAPYNGSDTYLLPGFDHSLHFVTVDIRTGLSNYKVSPESMGKLKELMQVLDTYLDELIPRIPEIREVYAFTGSAYGLKPYFSMDDIKRIRGTLPPLNRSLVNKFLSRG